MDGSDNHDNRYSEKPPKKRVRKSGLVYRSYLTNRARLEHAPLSFKKSALSSSSNSDEIANSGDTANSVEIANFGDTANCGDTANSGDTANTADTVHNYSVPATQCDDRSEGNEGVYTIRNEFNLDQEDDDSINLATYDSSDESSFSDCLTELTFSSSAEEEFDENDKDLNLPDMPIYEGAQLKTGASMLLIMSYILEHNLTGEAFSDLLNLISLHCRQNNTIPTSVHLFKQWFHDLKIQPRKHLYCSSCLFTIDQSTVDRCLNPACAKPFDKKSDKSFFVEVPLIEQIKKLMYDKEFRAKLNFRFDRKKKIEDNIEDIYDGKHYKQYDEILSSRNNISFMWNTDGVPLFKSSKTSMWPLYYVINELPFKMRREPGNMLLAGLWIGPKKPEMLTFLRPFIADLQSLENGISVNTDENDCITVKGLLLAGTADLPAKCTVCNMTQYNGKYSCPCCMQSGQSATAGKGRCQVFPFDFENPTGPERSHDDSLKMAEIATNSGKPEYGIKGPCWFTTLQSYDFVKGNCIDYMHCVLLGITKLLISLWFSKGSSGKQYCVASKQNLVDDRIENIKPPVNVKRKPRSINDLKYWKASEFRSWLLFYAPVVLFDILSHDYYVHFLLFSNAIFLLLQSSVSEADILKAENFLEHFVSRFSELYEDRYMTLNMHLLLHLPENVRNLGPLWATSCFPFEDANGYLLKLVRGTQSVESQIIDSITVIHGIPYLKKHCIVPGSKEEELLNKLGNISDKNITRLSDEMYVLGKISEKQPEDLSNDILISLTRYLNKPVNGTIKTFKRLKKNNRVYHSLEYTRVRVRNSYTIRYKTTTGTVAYGLVKFYLQYSPYLTQNEYILAIVTPLILNTEDEHQFPHDDITDQGLMGHISVCNAPHYAAQPLVISVDNIIDLCVMVTVSGKPVCYVVTIPNKLEKD